MKKKSSIVLIGIMCALIALGQIPAQTPIMRFNNRLHSDKNILLKTMSGIWHTGVSLTSVGLINLDVDSTYIVKSNMSPNGYKGKWTLSGDTIIFYENNDIFFFTEDGQPKPEIDLVDIDSFSFEKPTAWGGQKFGRIFYRDYEQGHTLQWRNELRALIAEDSIGLYFRPLRYRFGWVDNPFDDYFTCIRVMPDTPTCFDSFIPYTVRWRDIRNPEQKIYFPPFGEASGIWPTDPFIVHDNASGKRIKTF